MRKANHNYFEIITLEGDDHRWIGWIPNNEGNFVGGPTERAVIAKVLVQLTQDVEEGVVNSIEDGEPKQETIAMPAELPEGF